MHAFVIAVRKHSDRAQILTLYSLDRGRIDAFMYGAGGRKHSLGIYSPMNEINVTLEEHPGRPAIIKEASLIRSVPGNPESQWVALSLAEVVYRTFSESMADEAVYSLIQQTVQSQLEMKIVPTFLSALSHVLGYGGLPLEEWQHLTSLSVYQDLIH